MGRKPEIDKPQQQAFARHMAATGNATYAAEKAGYAHPHRTGAAMMARTAVAADVRAKQLKRLVDDALPLAVNTVIGVMTDPKSTERGRLIAAKIVLDQVKGMDPALERKEAHEMSAEELQRALQLGEARLAALRGDVEDAEIIADEPVANDLQQDHPKVPETGVFG